MGGEITWSCSGSGYVFELVFYRDCNGADVNTVSESIQVWNHSTISTIPVAFISRVDISPFCSVVAGSPPQLDCTPGGVGLGSIERVTYRSNPIILVGVPPSGTGWIFTYNNFSRNNNITNLVNPSTYGLTITAKLFASPSATPDVCFDNSPKFLQDAYLVSCAGENYEYNMHPVDVDLDSLSLSFGTPLDDFTGTYNPPTSPSFVPFETGFSTNSPTPDASFNAGNVATALNPQSGVLTFRSVTVGSYVVKIVAQSFREGILIAEVEREMQLTVLNCTASNNAPVITPPFAGLFETTVDAGTLVTFNLDATDVEVLQDGSPQMNTLTTTGLTYGTNFTSTSGCAVAPCATLNTMPPITGVQGVSAQFSWQTDCDHLLSYAGEGEIIVPYHFVFKVQDNYCQIPKTSYKTVTIYVRNPGIIPATSISCITTAANGDVTVSWNPVTDPDGTFVQYELHSVQNGLEGTFPIGTTSAVIPFPNQRLDFYVNVVSGCGGNSFRTSDTLSNVFLDVTNPSNGTAVLQWNSPSPTPLPVMNPFVTILREYPIGTFTPIASVPFGTTFFVDTIDICQALINYQVFYTIPGCVFDSNIDGEIFEDQINPDIPTIASVSIDTLTGNVVITWNVNNQPDTYGYVIYQQDENGFIVEIDTVYGINNTTYTHVFPVDGPLTYSVAAFDSCFTSGTPPTYQTSAKADLHTSMYLTNTINICNSTVDLSWTAYAGWGTNLIDYTVFIQENGGVWVAQSPNSSGTTLSVELNPLSNYRIVVRANNSNGSESFSNVINFALTGPTPPAVHYLRVATVEGETIELRHEITTGSNVESIAIDKYDIKTGVFTRIAVLPATQTTLSYTDADVDVHRLSYRYRATIIDSCGNIGTTSNEAETVLLQVQTDQTMQINYLNWSPYQEFAGSVYNYNVYRGIDGIYDPNPIASLPNDQRFYEDNVSSFEEFSGLICYRIVADEGDNQFGFSEVSNSNEECPVVQPIVYIPNAFTPGGLNPVFKPIVSFTNLNAYELSIVDRWGEAIFVTKDPDLGWGGASVNGSNDYVALGTYGYVLRILDGNNQELVYRGHVTVLH